MLSMYHLSKEESERVRIVKFIAIEKGLSQVGHSRMQCTDFFCFLCQDGQRLTLHTENPSIKPQ